ncbi:MAG: hypothetical protein P4M14_03640 [Gammaproteobacteria bacterium]|nr:hypothetical protein [Gammaproteobacteria bacterium]
MCVCVCTREGCVCVCVCVRFSFWREHIVDQAHVSPSQVCGCLRNLSLNDINRTAVVSCGGVEKLFNVLRLHRSHAGVTEQALACLGNLTNNEAARTAVVIAGSFGVVLDAMSRLPTVPVTVLVQCCIVIGNMCASPANQALALEAGAAEALLTAMDKHKTSEKKKE